MVDYLFLCDSYTTLKSLRKEYVLKEVVLLQNVVLHYRWLCLMCSGRFTFDVSSSHDTPTGTWGVGGVNESQPVYDDTESEGTLQVGCP